jgi:hypothetical protein
MSINKAPEAEQKICVGCGFCCDGTLFIHAVLKPGERTSVPEKIRAQVFNEGEKDYFWLPCSYFSQKCTIYDNRRADVCGTYRCQLLRDFAGGKITLEEALGVVKEARAMRSDLLGQYRTLTGSNEELHFIRLLMKLGKLQETEGEKEQPDMDFEILLARCNIFETLLIKHFRSAGDFGKMQITNEIKVTKAGEISI